jgi:hypothetical protein
VKRPAWETPDYEYRTAMVMHFNLLSIGYFGGWQSLKSVIFRRFSRLRVLLVIWYLRGGLSAFEASIMCHLPSSQTIFVEF